MVENDELNINKKHLVHQDEFDAKNEMLLLKMNYVMKSDCQKDEFTIWKTQNNLSTEDNF